jgi:hypothetical protein
LKPLPVNCSSYLAFSSSGVMGLSKDLSVVSCAYRMTN